MYLNHVESNKSMKIFYYFKKQEYTQYELCVLLYAQIEVRTSLDSIE